MSDVAVPQNRGRPRRHLCSPALGPLNASPDGRQTCRCCGVVQRVVWSVPDLVWKHLPEEWRAVTLCLECFAGRVGDAPGGTPSFTLTVEVVPELWS